MIIYLAYASILFGVISAVGWLRASTVKVTREQEVARRVKAAEKKGIKPNLSGVTLDGWDMSATFRAQTLWNSIAAISAAVSILLQAVIQANQL